MHPNFYFGKSNWAPFKFDLGVDLAKLCYISAKICWELAKNQLVSDCINAHSSHPPIDAKEIQDRKDTKRGAAVTDLWPPSTDPPPPLGTKRARLSIYELAISKASAQFASSDIPPPKIGYNWPSGLNFPFFQFPKTTSFRLLFLNSGSPKTSPESQKKMISELL